MALDLLRQVFDIDRWQPKAACREPHPEADWFPDHGQAVAPKTRAAVEVCAGCPVRVECFLYAVLMDGHHAAGIYGGQSPRRRMKLRGTMARLGLPVDLRMCNECGHLFPAVGHSRRAGVCCSDECRRLHERGRKPGRAAVELRASVVGHLADRRRPA